MTMAMRRRGPDGSGRWVDATASIGLGHRRLAIIDLSSHADQPLWSNDKRYVISFNGEIYNYKLLRKELTRQGAQFLTESDTEVILELFRLDGPAGFSRLRGMYAFAIWDSVENALVLARDPLGIKPLYLYKKGSELRFASQVKALLAAGDLDTTPDPAGHVGFHVWGHVPEPFTLYRYISAFPAGHYQIISRTGHSEPRPIQDLAELFISAERSTQERAATTQAELKDCILDSLRHHLVSDVPVGIFLSAGKDSSVLAALTKEAGYSVPRTFTLGFEEFRDSPRDEVPLAEQTASLLNTEHLTKWVTQDEFFSMFDDIMDAMDQPSVDGVNTYLVAKYAAQAGLKVALSGVGGDELFGGYSSFVEVPRLVSMTRHAPRVLGVALRRLSQSWIGALTSPKYASLLEYGNSIEGAYTLRRALYMPWELHQIMDPDLATEGLERLALLDDLHNRIRGLKSPYLAVMQLEMTVYMRDRLLRDADWASMAHSLELRMPLVDWSLYSALAPSLASSYRPDKDALGALATGLLPKAVLDRPKSGFAVPINTWLMRSSAQSSRGLRGFASLIYDKFAP